MRFPLAEAINAGQCYDTAYRRMAASLPDDLPYVNCDAVSAYYWESEKDYFNFRSNDFGIIKPPFPLMYLEWEIPRRCHADGRWMGRETLYDRQATLIFSEEDEDGNGVICMTLECRKQNRALLMPWGVIVGFDGHGMFRSLEGSNGIEGVLVAGRNDIGSAKMAEIEGERPGTLVESTAIWAHVVGLALSFMHCRSAGVDWVTVPPKVLASRERRHIKGPASYGCVKVPGGLSRSSTRQDRRKVIEGQMPAYWVRGHFKTYTPDAPLFGTRTGSWWWQPTIRGVGEAKHRQYEVIPTSSIHTTNESESSDAAS